MNKTQYKYAMHENNVILREWCNENLGRAAALSEQIFPETKNSRSTISKFKCGQQYVDNAMLEKCRPIMDQIVMEENQGKRKIYTRKMKGPCLETSKYNNYKEVETSSEYTEYKNFHRKYFMHFFIFTKQFDLYLPLVANPSNLVDMKFVRKVRKAMKYVEEFNLESSVKLSKKVMAEVREKEAHSHKTRIEKSAVKESNKVIKTTKEKVIIKQITTDKEEFNSVVDQISQCEKLSKLVPIILMMEFSSSTDYDQAESIYKKFINVSVSFSIVKLINLKSVFNKANDLISNGWNLGDTIVL